MLGHQNVSQKGLGVLSRRCNEVPNTVSESRVLAFFIVTIGNGLEMERGVKPMLNGYCFYIGYQSTDVEWGEMGIVSTSVISKPM